MNQRLMAFIEYDLFPYLVCREVEFFNTNGTINCKGYTYKYKFILPYECGELLAEKLNEIVSSKKAKEVELDNIFNKELAELLQKYGQ